jgi:hypothetical protein
MDTEHGQYIEALIALGGQSWTKGDNYRIYFNDPATWAGLELEHYNTGNISSAAWRGEDISNAQGALISGAVEKLWFDVPAWKWMARLNPYAKTRHASKAEILDAALKHIQEAVTAWLADKYGDQNDSAPQH